jgi:hypothetical protein
MTVSVKMFGPANYLVERADLIEEFLQARSSGTLTELGPPTNDPDVITLNSLKLYYFASALSGLTSDIKFTDRTYESGEPRDTVSNRTAPMYERCLPLYHQGKWYVARDPPPVGLMAPKTRQEKTKIPRVMGLVVSTRSLLGIGAKRTYATPEMVIGLRDLSSTRKPDPYYDSDTKVPEVISIDKDDYEAWEAIYHANEEREVISMFVVATVATYGKGTRIPKKFTPPILVPKTYRKKKTLRWAPGVMSPVKRWDADDRDEEEEFFEEEDA